jgi:hypothetical protein
MACTASIRGRSCTARGETPRRDDADAVPHSIWPLREPFEIVRLRKSCGNSADSKGLIGRMLSEHLNRGRGWAGHHPQSRLREEMVMARVHPGQLTNDWPSVLHFLTGEALSSDIEHKAIAAISRDMEHEDRREREKRAEWARISKESRAIRRKAPDGDDRVAKVQAPLRAALKKWGEHKLVVPEVEREEASLSAGSISATIVPPYDFPWTSQKQDGPADLHTEARKTDGYLYSDVNCPEDGDASDGRAWSAVGAFFKPAFTGVVQFSAAFPSIISYWYTGVSNADAQTAGKVGLRVYQFVNGKQNPPDSYLKQHSILLWDVKSTADLFAIGGDGPNSDAYSPSLTLQFNASKDAYYNLWVYMKTGASADGGGTFYDSSARAEMNGFVPSMQWKLSL